ncbi:hypothetical protein ACWCV2_16985 [Streptomyces pseudogriseolus]
MASAKTTYRTTHPSTNEEVTFTKGGRPVRWITWGDFDNGEGFVHFGYSSQEEYAKAVKAPRSTNPYAKRYEATPATVVEDETPTAAPAAEEAEEPQPQPRTEIKDSSQLAEGDIVRDHGMRVRLDELTTTERQGLTVYRWAGTVLNIDEVREAQHVPMSFLRTTKWEAGRGWVTDREDYWAVQGNKLATWAVEVPDDRA